MSIITRYLNKIKLFIIRHPEEIGVSIIIATVAISSFLLGKYSVLKGVGDSSDITFENNTLDTSAKQTSSNTVPLTKIDNSDKTITGQARLSSPADSADGGQARLPSTAVSDNGGQVVASKNGTKYYLPWCGSAERILAKNKVFFASALEAEKAGFAKASNCKGM